LKPLRLAWYVTPHGFGHAVRSLEVVKALLELDAVGEVILVSDFPRFLVEQNVGKSLPFRCRPLDVGLVQRDSLRFDLEATLKALESLYFRREELVEEEAAFLREEGVDGVICDIPFLPFRAAERCGIPSAGMSNFTWDWIYRAYARSDDRWRPLLEWIREDYGRCPLFLQLPMHGDCSVFPRIREVPLVARKASRTREDVRRILGLSTGHKAYLVSFAWLDLDEKALRRVERLRSVRFLYKRPLRFSLSNGISLDELPLTYPDVVAAVDGVITKPGYGIVADCLAHGTPVAYTDRGFFPEYEILVEAVAAKLPSVHMPSEDLYAGRWEEALRALQALPPRGEVVAGDGASVCARAIVEHFRGS